MKSEIIKSETSLKRYKGIAFILSFLFTGLGQVYNGDFSKGIVFFILRIFSVLVIPFYAVINPGSLPVLFFIIAVAVHFSIWLISPAEAIYSAGGKQAFNLRKYNSVLFYLVYMIINSAVMIFTVLMILSFFSIGKINTVDMEPGLMKDDFTLINKFAANDIDIGDVVIYSSKNDSIEGRIIARDGDTISKKGNDYYINDAALQYSILSKTQADKMGIDNSEDLFYEINVERKYPVKRRSDEFKNTLAVKPVLLGNGELFIAFDNRSQNGLYDIINSSAVIGRVEGIIFSKNYKRIFNKPYLTAE